MGAKHKWFMPRPYKPETLTRQCVCSIQTAPILERRSQMDKNTLSKHRWIYEMYINEKMKYTSSVTRLST